MHPLLKTADDILEVIADVDKKLDVAGLKEGDYIPVILVGGAAVLLSHKGKRFTHDVDALNTRSIRGLGSIVEKLHVVSDSIACLHPGYIDRIIKQQTLKYIEVYTLNPIDIAISKTGRGLEKDFYDLYVSDVFAQIDLDEFIRLYKEGVDFWICDRNQVLANLERAVDIAIERG
jgi:hypothetical protein